MNIENKWTSDEAKRLCETLAAQRVEALERHDANLAGHILSEICSLLIRFTTPVVVLSRFEHAALKFDATLLFRD